MGHYFAEAGLCWGAEVSSTELRRRRRETEERKESRRRRRSFIARPRERGNDTQRPSHASTKPRAATGASRRPEKGRRRWGSGHALFTRITELPSVLKFKLLRNFLKKLKISKNKSCSKTKVLQLCLNEHFQILPPFWNLNLGCI